MIKLIEPKDKVILDCGTGKGRTAIGLVKEGAKLAIGIDISEEMLEVAKERAKVENVLDRIIFEEGDAENLKYPDNYFDAVVCLQTLMHLPNPQKCINELARVVKLGGIVIADHINRNPLWRISIRGWKNFLVVGILEKVYFFALFSPFRMLFHKLGYPSHPIVKRTSKREFFGFFTKSKLKVVQTLDYGFGYCPVYFLVCAKKGEL